MVTPALVFLARFNGYGTIGFVFFFSALMIGGDSAARLGRRGEFWGLREWREGDDRRDIRARG